MEPLYQIEYYHLRGESDATPPPGLVSIIIASYNYEQYVIDTLESVARQTHPELELVVVDDCSQDNSVRAIIAWLPAHHERFERIVVARSLENQGLAQTRNSAIRLSRGRRLFVLDSDNILMPKAIARHAEVMDRTNLQVVYSQFEWFDAERRVGLADFWDRDRLGSGNYVDAMALISRPAWDEVGGYSHFDVMGWEDYDLWLKFIDHGFSGAFIPEVLCRYRVHRRSMMHLETRLKGLRLSIEIAARHPWLTL